MVGFRGIGDSATTVKMQQDQQQIQRDQMALQAATSVASRASSESMANASRAESGRQFNASKAQQAGQFDASLAAQQENTTWTRSQAEQANAENTRRFDIGQQAVGRQEKREERQLTIEDFRKRLDERRTDAELGLRDVQTKEANLRLNQYVAAADEAKRADAAREKLAHTALAGLLIATELNGGTAPVAALELFNQQVGDKYNRAVGVGRDPVTGLAFADMEHTDPETNTMTKVQRQLTPQNQYAAMYVGLSKEQAEDWHDRYEKGSSARAASDIERNKRQEIEDAEIAKEDRKLQTERLDPFKRTGMFLEQAKAFEKMAAVEYDPNATDVERKGYRDQAAIYRKMADSLLMPQKEGPKQVPITPAMLKQYNVPELAKPKQNPDGTISYMWKDEQGRTLEERFGMDAKPVNMGGTQATAPAPKAAAKPSAVAVAQVVAQPPAKAMTTDEQAQEFANTLADRGLSPEKARVAMTNHFGEKYANVQGVSNSDREIGGVLTTLNDKNPDIAAEASAIVERLKQGGSSTQQIIRALKNRYGTKLKL